MKVFFSVVDTSDANAILSSDSIEIQLEKTWYRLETMAALGKDVVMAKTAANTIGVWLSWPGKIQGARFTTQASALTTAPLDIISDNDPDIYENILAVNVNEFQPGVSYLIPFTAGACTDIMPQGMIIPIENTADGVFIPTHYKYDCPVKTQVRNGATVNNVIVYNTKVAALVEVAQKSIAKDNTRSVQFVRNAISQ